MIEIDSNFDLKIKEFEKQLNENEEIVATETAGTKFVITTKTREGRKRGKHLLLEEIQKGTIPDVLNIVNK